MKLRIHKNSIRLRLSQPEVEEIAQSKAIVETLDIGGSRGHNFSYSLLPLVEVEAISAEFAQNNLKIYFPKHQAEEWATTDRVGISQSLGNGVNILIEKDFQCLHKRPEEDETNNFPNPLQAET